MNNLAILQLPLASLHPYAHNPRKNDAAVPRMVEVLQEFGFRVPILAKSDGEIIDGHLRYKAAQSMGLTEVPVILADDMSEAQIRAFQIMINRSANWAEWDEDLLLDELKAVELSDLDIKFTGFDMDELAKLLPNEETNNAQDESPENEESIPDPLPGPVSQTGDIWLLGDHALICGDSGDPACISQLMGDFRASICFTSPPYGQQRQYMEKIGDWDGLMKRVFANVPLTENGQLLVNLGLIRIDGRVQRYWAGWITWMEANGWRLYDWYVWDQASGLPGYYAGHLLPSHEWVFHLNKQPVDCQKIVDCLHAGETRSGSGMRNPDGTVGKYSQDSVTIQNKKVPDSVIRIRRQVGRIGKDIDHPAVFPPALPEFMYSVWTQPGAIVFEPFSGSGSSIIAAQRSGRIARAVEIAPAYVDVSLIRFGRLFPDVPIILKETGETFDQVAARRKEGKI